MRVASVTPMKPGGSAYRRTSGSPLLLGGVDPSRFANPDLLKTVAVDFAQYYPEESTPTQKYFKDLAGIWHYVTADGSVYQRTSGNALLVGGVDPSYFSKPNDLVIDY
jgi:hypothetical protein